MDAPGLDLNAPCRTAWGPRLLGLAVLAAAGVGAMALAVSSKDVPTWTWIVLTVFGGAAAATTVSNFGDLYELDDDGIVYRNTLTRRLGWARHRRVAWSEVVQASEYEGRTWFLTTKTGERWVLDQLDGHERLRFVLRERGVPTRAVERPRLLGRRPTDTR